MPVAFFSKALSAAEKKYLEFDRELLAIYGSIKHFRHFIEGRQFMVFTDHKPLTYALTSSPTHLSYIAEITTDIRHVKGSDVVTDTLSRPLAATSCELPRIYFTALAATQDPRDAKHTSLEVSPVTWQGLRLLCDMSTGSPRPLVSLRLQTSDFCRPPLIEPCRGPTDFT